MGEGERTAWYRAALMTIGDIPESHLERACAAGRKVCDHPAKIVPFICAYDPDMLKRLHDTLRHAIKRHENLNAPRIEQHDPQYMTADDLAELKVEIGSKA